MTDCENGDLRLMKEYDFKTPINATVLYEDEEERIEEKEPFNEKVTSNVENMSSEIIKNIRNESKFKSQKTNANITTSDLLDTCESGDSIETLNNNNNTNANNNLVRDDNIQTTSNIRNSNNEQTATSLQGVNSHQLDQHDTNQNVSICVQSLLDTVSLHLIFILKAFNEYKLLRSSTSDTRFLEPAWKRYHDLKYRLYYVSCSTVSNIMIPKKKDKVFIENFITNTIKLAKIRQFDCCPYEVSLLCIDMFKWVKTRIHNPVLTDLLQNGHEKTTAVENITRCNEQQDRTNTINNTCVFRSGPVGRELTISVRDSVIQNNQITSNQSNLPYNVSAQQNKTYTALTNNSMCNSSQEYQYSTNKQTPTYPCKFKPRRKKPPVKKTQQNLNQESCVLNKPPPPYSYTHYQQELTTSMNCQSYATTQFLNPARNNYLQGNQEQLDVNKSLSRDSGFISPLSSSSNELSCSPRYEFDPSASATPLITHVTSLNPGVAYIMDGQCHVCGKLTKQKCLGCYKCYYCSHHCQMLDWRFHYFNCK